MPMQRLEPPIIRRDSLGVCCSGARYGAQPRSSRGHGPPPAQAVIHVSHKPPVTSWLVVFLPVQYRSGAANTESSDSQLHSLVGVKKTPSCSFHIFYLFLGNWKTIFIREKFVSMTIKVSARGKCHISRK